jgi:four helix bundle protein
VEKTRELTKAIYRLTEEGKFARDFGLKDQIRRASVSIMSNIAEGYERDGNNELRQFLSLAKGSVGEVKAQLYVALDAGFLQQSQFDDLYRLSQETSRLIGDFLRYLANSDSKGSKFREEIYPYLAITDDPELGTWDQELGTRN